MELHLDGIEQDRPIPERFAFGVPDADQHVALGANRNPALTWRDPPDGTRSLVLICVDSDVPTKPDDVNVEGREVPASLPRADFFHWVMVDIDPTLGGIPEGSCSDGVTAGGKRVPAGPAGTRQGLNDYTGWFAGDAGMAGEYLGYDGPCPPWNDAIAHRYHFMLYATDLARCPVGDRFTAADVLAEIEGHVLAEAKVTGTYALNPAVTP